MPDAGAGTPKIAGSPFQTDPGARSRLAPSVVGRALLKCEGAGQHPYDGLIVSISPRVVVSIGTAATGSRTFAMVDGRPRHRPRLGKLRCRRCVERWEIDRAKAPEMAVDRSG